MVMRRDAGSENDLKKSFSLVATQTPRILILGSLPGDASLKENQYYAHPRNAFWSIMGELFSFSTELTYEERLDCLNRGGVALWDVVSAGKRPGSLDSNISEVIPNDIAGVVERYPSLQLICCNGGKAYDLLKRHFPQLWSRAGLCVCKLPSTSPAAARCSYQNKLEAYKEALGKAGDIPGA